MIVQLLNLLQSSGLKIPAVFGYTSTKMMLAAMTSLIISIFLGPYFIRKLTELKIGQEIRKQHCEVLAELHKKKQNTPTMGGVLILFSMLVSMFLFMDLSSIFTLVLLVTTVFLGVVGGLDDYLKLKYKNSRGLPGKYKLLGQAILSLLLSVYLLYPSASQVIQAGKWFSPPVIKEYVQEKNPAKELSEGQPTSSARQLSLQEYASRVYIPFLKDPVMVFTGAWTLLAALFIIFVVTGASNAVNLTDGLDGLAAGCVIMAASCFALIAFVSNNSDFARYLNILYVEGSGEIGIYLAALIGSCLGFLWYNGYPAEVFMGDTGSLTLGGLLGVSAVLLNREFLLALVGGIFVAEAMSVILQVASYRLFKKRRIFRCAPLHHHFEYKGWAEAKVVVRFWIVGLLLALLGVASLKFQ